MKNSDLEVQIIYYVTSIKCNERNMKTEGNGQEEWKGRV